MGFGVARRVSAALVAFATAQVGLAGSAVAASIPDNLVNSLSYKVVGTITASCSLTQPTKDVEVVGLQNPASDTIQSTDTDLPFTVACTAPVKMTMASTQGGLKSDTQSSDGNFLSLVGYQATLNLPGASGALQCRSDQMANGGAQCTGELASQAPNGNGQIRIHTAASGSLLLAGTYNDTVTLTISPQLDGDGQSEGDD